MPAIWRGISSDHLSNGIGFVQHRNLDNQFHRGLAGGAARARSAIAGLGWQERLTVQNMLGRFLMLYRAAIVLHTPAFVKCVEELRTIGELKNRQNNGQ